MKVTILLSFVFLVGCKNTQNTNTTTHSDTITTIPDTIQVKEETKPEPLLSKKYSNQRFKDVTVEKIGQDSFFIRGQGQIFEANFNWVVEDGHDELKKGYQMTDAGAPEWGNFEFLLNVAKKRENSTLMLIIFESSAKDGSRQHQLMIALE